MFSLSFLNEIRSWLIGMLSSITISNRQMPSIWSMAKDNSLPCSSIDSYRLTAIEAVYRASLLLTETDIFFLFIFLFFTNFT